MLHLLIERVEHAHSARYCFSDGLSYDEKFALVQQWWYDKRFQLQMALKTPNELQLFINNVAASRRGHVMKLREVLGQLGVLGYYTFTVKGFEENRAVFAPNARSVQESTEEKQLSVLSPTEAGVLADAMKGAPNPGAALRRFMQTHKLKAVATDRNVVNLPAIGKSMTFQVIGLTPTGERVLRFEPDGTRRHSPVLDRIGPIHIVENRTLASYLRQLQTLGEDPDDYATAWNFTQIVTEQRFPLYRYPDFAFQLKPFEQRLADAAYA